MSPYRQHITTYRACQVIAMNIAALRLLPWTGPPEELDRKRVELPELTDLLARPNPWVKRQGSLLLTVLHLLTTGESWWQMKDQNGKQLRDPNERPRWIMFGSRSDVLFSTMRGVPEFTDKASREVLDLDSNIQHKMVNPENRYRGLGLIDIGGPEIETDWNAAEYNRGFFRNGAVPDGLITTTQQLGQPQVEALRSSFEARHRGARNSHRVAIMHSGMDYKRMGATSQEMEYLEGRRFARDQVSLLTGVPESELGITKDTKYNNGLTGNRALWSQTLLPLMELIESELNDPVRGLARRYDPSNRTYLGFDTARIEAIMDAIEDKLNQADRLWAKGVPLDVINKRLSLGLPENLPGSNEGWLPMGVVPVRQALAEADYAEENPDGAPANAPTTPPADEGKALAVRSAARKRSVETAHRRVVRLWTKTEAKVEKKTLLWMREYRRAMLDQVDAVGAKSYGSPDSRGVEHQKEAINKVVLRSTVDELLLNLGSWRKRLQGLLSTSYKYAVQGAANSVGYEIAGGLKVFDIGDPAIATFLKKLGENVTQVSDTVHTQLRDSLADGLHNGETIEDLKDRVREVMNAAATRAKTIARTEAGFAINGGRMETMKLEGVAGTEWSAMVDERTRDSHLEVAGEIQPLGRRFSNGLMYPMEQGADAEEVINCRCVAITVESVDADDEE